MFNIASYLEGFKTLGIKERETKDLFIDICREVAGVELGTSDFVFKKGVFCVHVSVIIKNTLFIKKERLLLEINKKAKTPVMDIAFF